MRKCFRLLTAVCLLWSTPALADLGHKNSQIKKSSYMRVFGNTLPPHGYVKFCAKHRYECRSDGRTKKRFAATPQLLSVLDQVNRRVNKFITPATDLELYGREEHWTLPKYRGDCEDYALLKRRLLMQRGWPASALLLTVVRDQQGDGHAVLTARTDQGDFILDNKDHKVRLWHQTPYTFIMRQSYLNPMAWMSLDPDQHWPVKAPLTSQPATNWSTKATSTSTR